MKMRSMVITALYYIYIYTYIYFEGREWRNSQKTKTNEMSRALAPSLKPGPRLINDNFDSSSSCYHYTHFFFFLSSFLPLTTQCTKRCWKLCLRNGTRACNKRSRRVDSTSSKIKCQKIKAKKKKKSESQRRIQEVDGTQQRTPTSSIDCWIHLWHKSVSPSYPFMRVRIL